MVSCCFWFLVHFPQYTGTALTDRFIYSTFKFGKKTIKEFKKQLDCCQYIVFSFFPKEAYIGCRNLNLVYRNVYAVLKNYVVSPVN